MIVRLVKNQLKRIPGLYALNARWRARRLVNENEAIQRSYGSTASRFGFSYSPEKAVALLHAKLSARGLPRRTAAERRCRILWVGTNWNQDNSGFLAALHRRGEVRVCVDWEGRYGLRSDSAERYDPTLVKRNSEVLIEQIRDMQSTGPIDLLIGQMWANFLSLESLQRAREAGAATVNIALDDRLPEHWRSWRGVRLGAVGLCPATDLVLTTAPEALIRYMVEDCPALFFPMASDPELFRPAPERAKVFDITFVGSRYGIRGRIVDALLRSGVHVEAFGPGWPNGSVDAGRATEIFSQSRIILGIGTVGHNDNVYTLKLRDFDGPMSGALYLTHRNPDLLALFEEGLEIVCYASIDECIEKARYYLAHPDERMAIARRGMFRARAEHTWDRRLTEIFQTIGLEQTEGQQKG